MGNCNNCGQRMEDDWRFCGNCGSSCHIPVPGLREPGTRRSLDSGAESLRLAAGPTSVPATPSMPYHRGALPEPVRPGAAASIPQPSPPAPTTRPSGLSAPATGNPRPPGKRALTGGAWLGGTGAAIALIAWLVYYEPVNAFTLHLQAITSLTRLPSYAPVKGVGTQEGAIGVAAALALGVAVVLAATWRRVFVLLAALASCVLIVVGRSALHPAITAYNTWSSLLNQLQAQQANSSSSGAFSGLLGSLLGRLDAAVTNTATTVYIHSVIPSWAAVAGGVIGLLGSLIAGYGALRLRKPASIPGVSDSW
jgi:hypothetical protein